MGMLPRQHRPIEYTKGLGIGLGKERQCHITKQLVHYFRLTSGIHVVLFITVLGLTNPEIAGYASNGVLIRDICRTETSRAGPNK